MAVTRWTDAENQTVREMYADGATDAEIGVALGYSHWTIKQRRELLGCTKYRHRRWTDAEKLELLSLLEDHTPWHQISTIMARRQSFIQRKAHELGASFRGQSGHYSLASAAESLGVEHGVVRRWIKAGRLKATRVPQEVGHNMWTFIDHDDLVEFLEDEGNWHLYKPERIADLALREWTTEIRSSIRFLTCSEAAPLLYMTPLALQKAVREGRIWGVQYGGRNSHWLLRSDRLVLAAAKRHTPKPPFSSEDLATIRRHWGKRPATWIARRLGRNRASGVANAAARLGLPAVGRGFWKRARATKGGNAHG